MNSDEPFATEIDLHAPNPQVVFLLQEFIFGNTAWIRVSQNPAQFCHSEYKKKPLAPECVAEE
jgi:hypothetical protein